MISRKNNLIAISILFILLFGCKESTKPDQDTEQNTIVGYYGQLEVQGNKIVGKAGKPVALHGMSMFWSQWIYKYYNKDCIEWLHDDWKCNIIRASLAVEHGGYLENPQLETRKIKTVVEACIDLGIYVIIDWHDHNAHLHPEAAVTFFTQMANTYGEHPNIIYEIYNEPEQVSWKENIKPYSIQIIEAIRAIDPDNIIVVGTPTWSQDVDIAVNDPLDYPNIAYSLHFYAASHKQSLRNKASIALSKGYALFVTEFGICEYTGDGAIDHVETQAWLQFMDKHDLSWCKWVVSDKGEGDSVLKEGADVAGGWPSSMLKPSGVLIRSEIIKRNAEVYEQLKLLN